MILVVLSTHAELASATARGRSYWETGRLQMPNKGVHLLFLKLFDPPVRGSLNIAEVLLDIHDLTIPKRIIAPLQNISVTNCKHKQCFGFKFDLFALFSAKNVLVRRMLGERCCLTTLLCICQWYL